MACILRSILQNITSHSQPYSSNQYSVILRCCIRTAAVNCNTSVPGRCHNAADKCSACQNKIDVNRPSMKSYCQISQYRSARQHLLSSIYRNKKTEWMCRSISFHESGRSRLYSTVSSKFTLRNNDYENYLDSLVKEHEDLDKLIQNGSSTTQMRQRFQELSNAVQAFSALRTNYAELEELENMRKDKEMRTLVEEELHLCMQSIEDMEEELLGHLVTEEKIDDCDIILELSAGVGGQEAMLFTTEIYEMYVGLASHMGWQLTQISLDQGEKGGYRSVSATITGKGVYRMLKYEGGVHRVQRIPKTEKSGRVHTSTTTVAVLPQPEEIDIKLEEKDLQIETFRASGKGGQHVNTTDSAVRIVHLPTGVRAECQVGRSQIANRNTALKVLKSRLYENERDRQVSSQEANRKLQVGSKSRSEKIRTYNFNQDRITDHRLGKNFSNMAEFMQGGPELEDMIYNMLDEARREILQEKIENFIKSQSVKGRKSKG